MRLRELLVARKQVVDPVEVPAPLSELPWEVAQKQFGVQGADFLAHFGRLLLFDSKKLVPAEVPETTGETGRHAGVAPGKPIPAPAGS